VYASECCGYPLNWVEVDYRKQEAHLEKWEGTGHAIHAQWPERFNKLLEDTFADGRQHIDDGWKPKV
jgi:pimeloyl-ACP methyl ester carboxylesterase